MTYGTTKSIGSQQRRAPPESLLPSVFSLLPLEPTQGSLCRREVLLHLVRGYVKKYAPHASRLPEAFAKVLNLDWSMETDPGKTPIWIGAIEHSRETRKSWKLSVSGYARGKRLYRILRWT